MLFQPPAVCERNDYVINNHIGSYIVYLPSNKFEDNYVCHKCSMFPFPHSNPGLPVFQLLWADPKLDWWFSLIFGAGMDIDQIQLSELKVIETFRIQMQNILNMYALNNSCILIETCLISDIKRSWYQKMYW